MTGLQSGLCSNRSHRQSQGNGPYLKYLPWVWLPVLCWQPRLFLSGLRSTAASVQIHCFLIPPAPAPGCRPTCLLPCYLPTYRGSNQVPWVTPYSRPCRHRHHPFFPLPLPKHQPHQAAASNLRCKPLLGPQPWPWPLPARTTPRWMPLTRFLTFLALSILGLVPPRLRSRPPPQHHLPTMALASGGTSVSSVA